MDDFANDKEIQRNRRKQQEHFQMIEDCINLVSGELELKEGSGFDLSNFTMIKSLPDTDCSDAYVSTNPLLPVRIFMIGYYTKVTIGKGSSSGTDNYPFALLTLKQEFPHTIIYPETLSEKVTELFVKAEIDFDEHRKFSWKFYTLTKDKEKLQQLLYNKQLNDLAKFGNMEMEINKNLRLIRHSRKPLSKTEAIAFCEFVKEVNRVLN